MVLHLGLLSNCSGPSIKGSLYIQSGLSCSCARDLGLNARDLGLNIVFVVSSVDLLFGELSFGFASHSDGLIPLFNLISPLFSRLFLIAL
jgi:hypothetical protein